MVAVGVRLKRRKETKQKNKKIKKIKEWENKINSADDDPAVASRNKHTAKPAGKLHIAYYGIFTSFISIQCIYFCCVYYVLLAHSRYI